MEMVYLWKNVASSLISRFVNGARDLSAPIRDRISDTKSQKRLILIIVCVALLLDNMLYMVIVPIITEYFKTTNATATTASTIVTTGRNIDMSGNSLDFQGEIKNWSHPMDTATERSKANPTYAPAVTTSGNEDALIGVLFASKAIVQLMANPFTGTFIDRVGYVMPLTLGLMVMFLSTSLFACAESFSVLFLARSMQGLGSALADTASLGLIADRFHDEKERSKALGIALAFISFGSLVAPPFGGILCEFAGREWPFLILAFVCLVDAMLLLLVQIPASDEHKAKDGNIPVGTPIYKLFIDPYIAVVAISLMIANFPLAFLEPTIAKWMEDNMQATKWQIGLVWLPAFIPHVLGVYLTVKLTATYFRYQWLYGALGLVLIGVSTAAVPTCKSYAVLMIPLAFMCFGIALIDTALLPTLAFLVDVRHTSVYGSVYAIADISYSIAYSLGPILAGQTVHVLGYMKMNVGIGLVNIMFSPMLLFLREVYDWKPDKSERATLLDPEVQVDPAAPPSPEDQIMKNDSYVIQHPKTRQGSVVSSDDEDWSSAHEKRRSMRKHHSRNGSLQSNGVSAMTEKGRQSDVIETSVAPRPRPRTGATSKKRSLVSVTGNESQPRYSTTAFAGNDVPTRRKSSGNFRSSSQSSLASQSSLSKGELKVLAETGIELRNPMFDNANDPE